MTCSGSASSTMVSTIRRASSGRDVIIGAFEARVIRLGGGARGSYISQHNEPSLRVERAYRVSPLNFTPEACLA